MPGVGPFVIFVILVYFCPTFIFIPLCIIIGIIVSAILLMTNIFTKEEELEKIDYARVDQRAFDYLR